MHKLSGIIAILCMAFSFIACEGPQGPQGRPGQDGLVNSKIIDIQIDQNQWQYSNIASNNYFFGVIAVPELTNDIYDNGMFKLYREYNTGSSSKSQVELPYTNLVEYPYEVEENGVKNTYWGFYTEHIYAEYAPGSITIFYLASDFDYELNEAFVPEAMHFRFIQMW